MALYQIFNGPMPTTASFVAVTTGTAIKTLLQVEPSATIIARIVEWGISFDGAAAGAGIECELIETDVAATVTAHVASGITKFGAAAMEGGDPTTNLIQVGTANTGYTSTAEGSITVIRLFDVQLVQPTGQYVKQFPLGREPTISINKFGRIRVKAAAAVNAICYMTIEI
jgi:hypothetical protein